MSTQFANSFLQGVQNHSQAQQLKGENEALGRETGVNLSGIRDPDLRKILVQNSMKQRGSAKDSESEEFSGLKNSLDWLDENIGYTGNKYIPFTKSFTGGGLNRETVGKRAEYDSAGFLAADQVYTHFNKGTISEAKLELIKKDLAPNSNLSERENKARVSALRRISNLPKNTNSKAVDKLINQELTAVKKISDHENKNKKLDLNQFFVK